MHNLLDKIINFHNQQVDYSIINSEQIKKLVEYLLDTIENKIEGNVVEFGCYVGESSKYLMKTLLETQSGKKLFVYDSFEGLPNLSKWEENTGWKSGTLKTTEEILISNFTQNDLPIPIIHKDWFKDIPEDKIPQKISFAFLDGDFYDSIYDSLNKIFDKVSDGGYICFHDYQRKDLPGVRAAIEQFFKEKNVNYSVIEVCDQLGVYKKGFNLKEKVHEKKENNDDGPTIVTGIWDLKRDTLNQGWSRSFDHYLNNLSNLMKSPNKMIIFIEKKYEEFVWSRRDKENTFVIIRELDWFKNNGDIFDKIQTIRTNPKWYNQVGWLTESTQAKLEMYNPVVMSKMFLLNDAVIMDPFNSSHLVWVDGGITNTVNEGYFWHDKVIRKLKIYFDKFSFVCFPYDGKLEIHGFEYDKMCEYSDHEVNMVARGGIFGGPKHSISNINRIYYDLLINTLSNGYMGTEESLFTIMTYKYPEFINYFEIESNGLLGTFFENLKNDNLVVKNTSKDILPERLDLDNVGLYVITFNSPRQFETLIESMIQYDRNFIDKPQKFLLDNSSDERTFQRYSELCQEFNFIHIKKDNLGICGGRQFIAEHADSNNFDYYFFFEDDMFFYPKKGEVCRNGFIRWVESFYDSTLQIIQKHDFHFLKFNYSEFFGDNGTQWSWYNVPQNIREQFFPQNPKLPQHGLDPNAPRTKYEHIWSHKGIPYVSGEVFYSNWPQVVSKEGNRKMFLDTTWTHPYEQTWMSHIYQETKKNNIKPALLLMTPTEHDRFEHYDRHLRKES